MRLDELGAFDELPAEERDWREDEKRIINEKVLNRPRDERGIAVAKDDHNLEAQTEVSTIWLEPAFVWKRHAIKALRLRCSIVANVRHENADLI